MRNLRLRNFRSFHDTGRITLRPITLLVGANSSGKSSYLRFFPLLRQTAEAATRSPLLWFGKLVDFGQFAQAATAGTDTISLEMDLEVAQPSFRRRPPVRRDPLTIAITIDIRAHENQTYVSKVGLACGEDACTLDFSNNGTVSSFMANGENVLTHIDPSDITTTPTAFIPLISYAEHSPEELYLPLNAFHETIADYLRPLAHNRTKPETLLHYSYQMRYGTTDSMLRVIGSRGIKHLDGIRADSKHFRRLRTLLLAKDVPYLLATVQQLLVRFASGIGYLGPFRKDPERYYRHQELSLGQMEAHGENLVMFLHSLTQPLLRDFSNFVFIHFGFHVATRSEGGHVAIHLSDNTGREHNLIDVGYGLSQVLPVIAQCWLTALNDRLSDRDAATTVLAIEQPELHLHPRHQSGLADMLATVLTRAQRPSSAWPHSGPDMEDASFPLQLLIETHSEALVNRFGELVASQMLDASNVVVLLFEKDAGSGVTTVRESGFATDGTLQNWPLGFFAP